MTDPSAGRLEQQPAFEVLELIRLWDLLEPYTTIESATPSLPRNVVNNLAAVRAVEQYVPLFAEELELVRRARNSEVHGNPLSPENRAEAVNAARQLWRILRQRLEQLGVVGLER